MKPKRKSRHFFRILALLFIAFLGIIIAYESGYYEKQASNKAILTKDAMQRFEQDVANGQVVDINNYLKEDHIDYSNKVTKIGNKVSNSLSKFMTKGISGLFNTLKGLFW